MVKVRIILLPQGPDVFRFYPSHPCKCPADSSGHGSDGVCVTCHVGTEQAGQVWILGIVCHGQGGRDRLNNTYPGTHHIVELMDKSLIIPLIGSGDVQANP